MHWQDACLKSPRKEAIRKDHLGNEERIFVRHWHGQVICKFRGELREALCSEVEGYRDWEPN